jgi:hypothetical protein
MTQDIREIIEQRIAEIKKWEEEGTLDQHMIPWEDVKKNILTRMRQRIQAKPRVFDPFEENGIQPY